jgi:MSHA biogenesis protein MshG
MPTFQYVARDATGGRFEGSLDAGDSAALADSLATQGLMLVRATERTQAAGSMDWLSVQLLGTRVQLEDLLLFCRQMATLMKAGVPILRSLRGLQESATNPRFGEVLGSLRQQLESGRELSASMQRESGVFSPYIVSMVRVGEVTGRLSEIFQGLFVQLGFERESREQVRSALRYPVFVIVVAFAAMMAVNLFVIPSFAKVYKSVHAELPLMTRILIGASDFTLAWWPAILALLVLAGIGIFLALRTPRGQEVRDGLILRLPIVGPLVHKAALARFTKSFGLALHAGVPVVDALQVALETADNLVLSARIGEMRAAAERGESLVRAARGTGVFTPTILQMIGVGEETGALGEMMSEIAEFYQKDVEFAVRGLSAKIEPILILVLGAIVLVIALGVFLPMWDLSRAVMHRN